MYLIYLLHRCANKNKQKWIYIWLQLECIIALKNSHGYILDEASMLLKSIYIFVCALIQPQRSLFKGIHHSQWKLPSLTRACTAKWDMSHETDQRHCAVSMSENKNRNRIKITVGSDNMWSSHECRNLKMINYSVSVYPDDIAKALTQRRPFLNGIVLIRSLDVASLKWRRF